MKIEVQAARAAQAWAVAARPAGRLSAALCRAPRARSPGCLNMRDVAAGRGIVGRVRRLLGAAQLCRNGAAMTVSTIRPHRSARRRCAREGRAVRRHLQPLFRARESRRRHQRADSRRLSRRMSRKPVDGEPRRCAAAAPSCRSVWSMRRAPRPSARSSGAGAVSRTRRAGHGAGAELPPGLPRRDSGR